MMSTDRYLRVEYRVRLATLVIVAAAALIVGILTGEPLAWVFAVGSGCMAAALVIMVRRFSRPGRWPRGRKANRLPLERPPSRRK
jgi:hypothetical protein